MYTGGIQISKGIMHLLAVAVALVARNRCEEQI